MGAVKIVEGLKEIAPLKINKPNGYVEITNGVTTLDFFILEVMSSLNFQYISTLEPPKSGFDVSTGFNVSIGVIWKNHLHHCLSGWKNKLGSQSRWKHQTFILKKHPNVNVQLLTIVGGQGKCFDFSWKISLVGEELHTVFIDCFDVASLDKLFNPFLVRFRHWWKKAAQDVLFE